MHTISLRSCTEGHPVFHIAYIAGVSRVSKDIAPSVPLMPLSPSVPLYPCMETSTCKTQYKLLPCLQARLRKNALSQGFDLLDESIDGCRGLILILFSRGFVRFKLSLNILDFAFVGREQPYGSADRMTCDVFIEIFRASQCPCSTLTLINHHQHRTDHGMA